MAKKAAPKPQSKKPVRKAAKAKPGKKAATEKHAGGRPTDYRAAFNAQVYKLCLLGAKDKEIADFFNVSEQTLNTWKQKHPQFLESMKRGKMQADSEIAESLFKRAKGFTHKEDQIFQYKGMPVVVPTTKHYPPDTGAAFIWLKNRAGWKDRQEVEIKGKGMKIIEPDVPGGE